MSLVPFTYRSRIYYEFAEIDRSEYRSIIEFYEENRKDIDSLDFEEYLELNLVYIQALFEIGAYNELLGSIDEALYMVIDQNIRDFEGKDIYADLLEKKAAALYNLRRTEEAMHVCRELIRMNKNYYMASHLLKRCLLRKSPKYVGRLRAISIFSLLITSASFGLELIVLEHWLQSWFPAVILVRNASLISGIAALVASWLAPQFVSTIQLEKILQDH
ncbi:MAG: hypothetical protein HKN16_03225 [Saprospiraceae bacterium]|nr:hypothetical protein [Saprospiraceae bacterium]